MTVSRAQAMATARYRDKTYDQLSILVKKGERDFYKQAAKQRGLSLSALIKASLEEYLQNHEPTEKVK